MSSFHHPLPFGAEPQPDGRTRFRLWAPSCPAMRLRLGGADHPMQAEPGGWHSLTLAAAPGTPYQYVTPEGLAVPDPASRAQRDDVHGPSLVVDPARHHWRHPDWRGRRWHEAVVYELHPGLMGGFDGIRAALPGLAALGVTAVELMPIADVPGPRNWGYDGVLPYAPDRALGTPEALKAMIDEAHGLGLMVFLDVVYNHFGPDGAYLHAYAREFFREDRQTPWGAAIDFRRREVRDFFEQNALYWLNEYRFDGLRFDAVHAIGDDGFLRELAATIRAAIPPGRYVHLVLENEANEAHLLRARDDEPLYDAQWADDWHHCLHVLLTGETEGYYADFSAATALLARCMAEGFAYQGQLAPHLDRPRGEPSAHLPPTAFVVCLQNHDQIGNRALGERLTSLAEPGALQAATALLLLSPFVPMLFMGEEWAATEPFLFFTSFEDELAEAVRQGRRAEFKHFAAFADPQARARIPDPNDPATFEASRPAARDAAHRAWVASLLALRAAHIVPGLPGCRALGARVLGEGAVQGAWALGTGQTLTIQLNLGARTIETAPPGRTALYASPGAAPGRLPPASIVAVLA